MRQGISTESAEGSPSVHFPAEPTPSVGKVKSKGSFFWLLGIVALILVGVAVWEPHVRPTGFYGWSCFRRGEWWPRRSIFGSWSR